MSVLARFRRWRRVLLLVVLALGSILIESTTRFWLVAFLAVGIPVLGLHAYVSRLDRRRGGPDRP